VIEVGRERETVEGGREGDQKEAKCGIEREREDEKLTNLEVVFIN
jgi:hypothetical protein